MDIKHKDIDVILYALCYASAILDTSIEDLEEKGFNTDYEKLRREEIKKGIDTLRKIRKELHLKE